MGNWLKYEDTVVEKLGKVLGVDPQDVGISASLTIGMHSLLSTFYKPDGKRNKIILFESEFTSDIIAAESWIDIFRLERKSLLLSKVSDKEPDVAIDNILKLIDEHKDSISIIAISLVSSHFSHYYDVKRLME